CASRGRILLQVNCDLVQLAGELERHLGLVLVDDRGSGVLADVEALIKRELADRAGFLDARLAHFSAVDRERSETTLAEAATVVGEVERDRVPARRERLATGDAGLVVSLFRVLGAVLVGVSVSENRLAVEDEQGPAAETSALRCQYALGSALRGLHLS